ncbi:MAG TPA: hypothetical protein VGA61_07315 [Anaerolineae bacterium]
MPDADNISIQERLHRDAGREMLRSAIFGGYSLAIISGTILLAAFVRPFPGWPWWAWVLLGLIGEIAVVISSLTDPGEQQRVIDAMFREKYNANGIADKSLRGKLAEAEQYRQRIQTVIDQQPKGVLRDRVAETTGQVYDWIANMVKLARRIDAYRGDQIIQRDLKNVPAEITELQKRISLERDARVKDQMNATLVARQQFKENLDELDGRMERADLQLDHSLAALGTVYSQTLLVGSRDVDSDQAERLRGDIRNEVLALQDLVESLNEVYSYQTQTMKTLTGADRAAEPPAAPPRQTSARG